MNDEIWKDAAVIDLVTQLGDKAPKTTLGYLAWDTDNLYLAFVNEEPNPAKIKILATERDGITQPYLWDDDSMDIILDSHPGTENSYFQFIFNAKGTGWDGYYGSSEFGQNVQRWNSHYEARTRIDRNAWSLEIKIPLKDLGIKGSPAGRTFTGNFFRNIAFVKEGLQRTCWSPTLIENNHRVDRFGFITFGPKK
jgi:hypothetical protein